MFDRTPRGSDIREAMQSLSDFGVTTVKVHFSGGDDEGGADSIDYLDADEKPVEVPVGHAVEDYHYENGRMSNGGWVVYDHSLSDNWNEQKRPATAEEIKWTKVSEVVEFPIYNEYGSFAGEFYVYGTLTWDVATARHDMHGQYESRSMESF